MIFFYLLVAIMPLVNHPLWSRFVGGLTLTKFVGLACLVYALGHCVARRSIPNVLGSWITRLFLLFYLLAVVSYFSKGDQTDWKISSLFSYTSFLFLLFVTVAVVDTLPRPAPDASGSHRFTGLRLPVCDSGMADVSQRVPGFSARLYHGRPELLYAFGGGLPSRWPTTSCGRRRASGAEAFAWRASW